MSADRGKLDCDHSSVRAAQSFAAPYRLVGLLTAGVAALMGSIAAASDETPSAASGHQINGAAVPRARPAADPAVADVGLKTSQIEDLFALAMQEASPSPDHNALSLALQPVGDGHFHDPSVDLVQRIGERLGLSARAGSRCAFDEYPFVIGTGERAMLYTVKLTSRPPGRSLTVMVGAAYGNLGASYREYRVRWRAGKIRAVPTGLTVIS